MPTHRNTVKKIIKFADIKPGEKAADLGSGDGRIVIALAKAGAEAHGYEINPVLVLLSRYKIRKQGLDNQAFVHWKSFRMESFRSFNIITLFGIDYIMKGLEKKLQKELTKDSRVICNVFSFPTWPCEKQEKGVYVYKK